LGSESVRYIAANWSAPELAARLLGLYSQALRHPFRES
jgi:hypothetical protein